MTKRSKLTVLTLFLIISLLDNDITYAHSIHDSLSSNSDIKFNDYLDFSYLSFIIQMVIGGAVAGALAILAYYRKFTNFLYKIFSKTKKKSDINNKIE
tara:strand:+ start:103 stop:396 length:294 start_codon:yes stop_codon:yes gene_type:complete